MIHLQLTIEEAKVLENVLASYPEALPAEQTAHFCEIQKQLDIVLQEYHYERSAANAEHQVEQRQDR